MRKLFLISLILLPLVCFSSDYNWDYFGYPKDINHLNSLDLDGEKILAVGNNGYIILSEDNGENFKTIDNNVKQDFIKVKFFNSAPFYLTKNTFYGQSFEILKSNANQFTNFILNDNKFYLTDDNGLIYVSSNFGVNWEEINIPEIENLKVLNLEFHNDNLIVVLDENYFYIYNFSNKNITKIDIPKKSIGVTSDLYNNILYLGCSNLKYLYEGFFKYDLIKNKYIEIGNKELLTFVKDIKVINDSIVYLSGRIGSGFFTNLMKTEDNFISIKDIKNSFNSNDIGYNHSKNEIIIASNNGHIFRNILSIDSTTTIKNKITPKNYENICEFKSNIIVSENNKLFKVSQNYISELFAVDSTKEFYNIVNIKSLENSLFILKEKSDYIKDSSGVSRYYYSYMVYKTNLDDIDLIDTFSFEGRFREIETNENYIAFCFTDKIIVYKDDNKLLHIDYDEKYPFFDITITENKIIAMSTDNLIIYNYQGELIKRIEIPNLSIFSKLTSFDNNKIIYTIYNFQEKSNSFFIFDINSYNFNKINNLIGNSQGISTVVLNEIKLVNNKLIAFQLSPVGTFSFSNYDSEEWEIAYNESNIISTSYPTMLIYENYIYSANGIVSRLELNDYLSTKQNIETKKINIKLSNNKLEFISQENITNVKVFDYTGNKYSLYMTSFNEFYINNLLPNSLILISFEIANETYIQKYYVID